VFVKRGTHEIKLLAFPLLPPPKKEKNPKVKTGNQTSTTT